MHTLLLSIALAAPGVTATTLDHRGGRYRVVTVDLQQAELRLLGQEPGDPHRFADLADEVVAATNASLFHTVDRPVGLWVQDGTEHAPLEVGGGRGNFFLAPNGVFAMGPDGPSVTPTGTWNAPEVDWAVQSGPLLLHAGEVHPGLDPDSTSLRRRNAVGACGPHTVALVASVGEVRFHDLATLFRDVLDCPDALYLDGSLSGIEGPGLPPAIDRTEVAGFLVAVPRTPAHGPLRDGDLVFQRSRSAQAAAIAEATGSRFTHVGLVRLVDGEPWVLEAVQPVRRTRWAAWAARGIDQEVVVRRPVDDPWSDDALARLDALQAAWLGRPYDAAFAPGDDALYCSELVREAYLGAAGVELAPLRPLGSYRIDGLEPALEARWGEVPHDQPVVAPSDLLHAPALQPVTGF